MMKVSVIVSVFILIASNAAQQQERKLLVNHLMNVINREFHNFKRSGKYDPNIPLPILNRAEDVRLTREPYNLIHHYQYKAEKHVVVTKDGYNLSMFRITGNATSPSAEGKAAVLLQHGIFSSSMDWIISGQNRSLALMLADNGFDVWLGNFRGTFYSREHEHLHLNESKYWDFSWHELGVVDLPTMIDYITAITGRRRIVYIGHSQGTTASYVMLSERPEYNDKITALFSLAPVAFCPHFNPILKFAAAFTNVVHQLLNLFRIYEFSPITKELADLVQQFCFANKDGFQFCKNLLFTLFGRSERQFDPDLYLIGLRHLPAGASTKQLAHYGQIINSGYFRQFDYGPLKNLERYRSTVPPNYNLRNIKVPVTIFLSNNDLFAAPVDVMKLYKSLPYQNGLYYIKDQLFNHLDYIFGKEVKSLVYDELVYLAAKHAN